MDTPMPEEEKPPLSELIKLAGGMAMAAHLASMNEPRTERLTDLVRKGCVLVSKRTFRVILPP
jgi:hypothetical protein